VYSFIYGGFQITASKPHFEKTSVNSFSQSKALIFLMVVSSTTHNDP